MLGIPLPTMPVKPSDSEPQAETSRPANEEVKREVLYSWNAVSRPTQQTINPKMTRTFIVIGVVISLVFVAMQQFFLIMGILSLVFVSYMLMQVPAEEVGYEISNLDLKYGERAYKWRELLQFFFMETAGMDVVAVDVREGLPSRLYLTLLPGDKEKIRHFLGDHLPYLEAEPKTFADKAYESVVGKLNLK